MNTTHISQRSVTAALGAVVAGAAAASALLFLGAGTSHAADFDPQPDPPKYSDTLNPPPG